MSHQSEQIAEDILGYLKTHENKDLLRFITCGNVDDGKSTLIGRLLHDSKLIFEDQLAAIERDSQKYNTTEDTLDLALLVDGLQAEREQGITIDVAYRYFSTEKRKFIIADCPGHEQYTRNMATGASTCNLAVILIDARYGVQTQTRRHSYIVNLLGIKHIVVAINKMDIVGFSESTYNQIKTDYATFAKALDIPDIHFIPISALKGDNVVNASTNMPWYQGETFMQTLENVQLISPNHIDGFRLPVQYVNRPNLDFRGFCGTVAAGQISVGETITALPSGKTSTVTAVIGSDGEQAIMGQAITVTLADEIDISRGDMIVTGNKPHVSQAFDANVVWMNETPLYLNKEYAFKLAGKTVFGRVEKINHRTDVNSLEQVHASVLNLNEIGQCRIVLNAPVVFDTYSQCRHTGNFIIIDRLSNATAAAGMVYATAVADLSVISLKNTEFLRDLPEAELRAFAENTYPHWFNNPTGN